MKKKLFGLLLALVIVLSCSATAFADDWTVVFKNNQTFGGTLPEAGIHDFIDDLEPGDSASFQVKITNEYGSPTRWYMWNRIIRSFEESSSNFANGGAYLYTLSYTSPSGTYYVLYSSKNVGGETKIAGRTGLKQATVNLEDYFFLDTLNSGESGTVTVDVTVDGETHGNVYQNTVADLAMRFAVEVTNTSTNRTAVKTGDENNLLPYYIGMVVAGLIFLFLALDAYTDKLYKKEQGRK